MRASVIASAAAARSLRYPSLARLIETERMTAQAIAHAFAMSASAGRDCALVILAGAHARYKVAAYDWETSVEHQLALDALWVEPKPEAMLTKLGKVASRIASQSWAEISTAVL